MTMALNLNTISASRPDSPSALDPFFHKYQLSLARKRKALERFRWTVGCDFNDIRDTAMIYLILKQNVIFSSVEMMSILGLRHDVSIEVKIFDKFEEVVRYVAQILKNKVPANSLLEMPLTDVSRICYGIASKFESLFFSPLAGREHSFDFCWRDRYNSMWPIVSELNRLYSEPKL